MNHTWKKNTCARCGLKRLLKGSRTLYLGTVYDFDGDPMRGWVERAPKCFKPRVAVAPKPSGVVIGDFGVSDRLPDTMVTIEFGDIKTMEAGKPVPFTRAGAPDHVHTPTLPKDATFAQLKARGELEF